MQGAVKSVKTRSNPQDSDQEPRDLTDCQWLCAQMAEVVRHAGTGLEWGAWWKSSLAAPGTRSLEETQSLTGNSTNTEVVAKERVNAVCDSCSACQAVSLLIDEYTHRLARPGHYI